MDSKCIVILEKAGVKTMSYTVTDFIVKRLSQWGVERCFGYSGDGINGFMNSLRKLRDELDFVQVRHEESAAFMATAHAKFTGKPGVCMATAGPGAMHLVTGLYDARMDHQPVVAIVGQKARHSMGSSFLQEADLHALFKDVSSEYLVTVNVPEQVPHAIDRAMRIAMDRRTVTTVIIPSDVQAMTMPESIEPIHGGARSGMGYEFPRLLPQQDSLDKAVDILKQSKQPAILIGAGCQGAQEALIEFANTLNAGVAKALLGKDVLPDDVPWCTGCIGLLGTEPSEWMMRNCDCLILIGTSFPYTEFLPEDTSIPSIHIDIQGKALSVNYPAQLNLVGDAKSTLEALTPCLEENTNHSWRESIAEHNKAWWEKLESRAFKDATPINPQRVFWELSNQLPDKAILCVDSGSSTSWFARDLKIRTGMKASLSGKLASMGCALPYAIAAKFAYPERTPVALVGDGAMQMLGITNLITIAKYWRSWKHPGFVIVVLNNRELAHVTWEMRAMEGDPKFDASQDIPDVAYADFAKQLGLAGARIESPEYIHETIAEAFNADIPFVIDAVTDPNVPATPPHITFDQAKNLMHAAIKGDSSVSSIIKQTARDAAPHFF